MGETLPNHHEDILQEKEDNSLQHYSLVHKFIPMPQAMKIPAAKAAVDKEWEKLEKISARNLTQVRSKKQVIEEARTTGAKVHFASLMDICHLENAELEVKHQKYKGRVVLRGDIVKRTTLDLTQYSPNKDHQLLKLQPPRSWISFPDCLVARNMELTQYLLKPK